MNNHSKSSAGRLIKDKPTVWVDDRGVEHFAGISDDILYYMDDHVDSGCKTLETGSGYSTVLFAMNGANHICVTPASMEVKRIIHYCDEKKISTGNIKFEIGRSEDVLPRLECEERDMVLIDGRHGFPTPFIDWFYANRLLKVGGKLIIDDIGIWPSGILKQFLLQEPEWKHIKEFRDRASVFEKTLEYDDSKPHEQQAFIASKKNPFLKKLKHYRNRVEMTFRIPRN